MSALPTHANFLIVDLVITTVQYVSSESILHTTQCIAYLIVVHDNSKENDLVSLKNMMV